MLLLKTYQGLARHVLALRMTGFQLIPKFHGLHHVAWSLAEDLRQNAQMSLSPLVAGCEQNEDVVGRISRLSRVLNTRTLTRRLLQRHFYKKKAVMKRLVPVCALRR